MCLVLKVELPHDSGCESNTDEVCKDKTFTPIEKPPIVDAVTLRMFTLLPCCLCFYPAECDGSIETRFSE